MMPMVGVGVFIIKDGKILLGKRKNSHGAGEWSLAGGHLEFGETWQGCAEREVYEETGLRIKNVRFFGATNDIFKEQKHFVTIFMVSDYESGKVSVKEPGKMEEWKWFFPGKLPSPLFTPIVNLIRDKGKLEF